MPQTRNKRPELANSASQKPGPPPNAQTLSLKWLTARPLSASQLRVKLERAGCPPEACDEAISEMMRLRYLNDRDLAQAVARDAARRGKGPLWLTQALRRRGLSSPPPSEDELIAETEAQATTQNAEDALSKAVDQFKRRNRDRLDLKDIKQRSRAMRFFASRGFTGGQTQKAMKLLRAEEQATEEDFSDDSSGA